MTRAGVAGLLALMLLGGCMAGDGPGRASTDPSSTTSTPSAEPEPVELSVVPVPAQVEGVRFANWSADGDRVVFNARSAGQPSDEIYLVSPDGTGLKCLSCGAQVGTGLDENAPLLKPIPFRDGQRILVRVGEQSPIKPADHGVLECAPSVAECTSARVLPIVAPSADDPSVRQDQREVRIAPDDTTVGLTQVRQRGAQVRQRGNGDGAMVAIVGRLRRVGVDGPEARYEVEDARVVSDLGELKGFTPDGAAALVAGFTTLPDRAANPDVVRVDLATGEVSDVTQADGYDEDIDFAPDQRSYVVASGRTSGLFEAVSQLHRPNFIGRGLEPLTAYLFTEHRADLLEPWLVPVGAEADGAIGQPLNPGSSAEGYDGRTLVRFHPEGNKVIWWEGTGDPFAPPKGPTTRIVIADLVAREPVDPVSATRSPVPDWAPELAGYLPPESTSAETRDGKAAGRVQVVERTAPSTSNHGSEAVTTTITVTYEGFADEAGWIIDGVESATFEDGLLGTTHYVADLSLTGRHEGWLRADAAISAAGIEGEITSSVDGKALRLPVGGDR